MYNRFLNFSNCCSFETYFLSLFSKPLLLSDKEELIVCSSGSRPKLGLSVMRPNAAVATGFTWLAAQEKGLNVVSRVAKGEDMMEEKEDGGEKEEACPFGYSCTGLQLFELAAMLIELEPAADTCSVDLAEFFIASLTFVAFDLPPLLDEDLRCGWGMNVETGPNLCFGGLVFETGWGMNDGIAPPRLVGVKVFAPEPLGGVYRPAECLGGVTVGE
jgi:hypothetical protein